MSKKIDILSHKLICVNQLLLDNLDFYKTNNPICEETKQAFIHFLEYVSGETANCESIIKSTYFHDLADSLEKLIINSDDIPQLNESQQLIMFLCDLLYDTVIELKTTSDDCNKYIHLINSFLESFYLDIGVSKDSINQFSYRGLCKKVETLFRKKFDSTK